MRDPFSLARIRRALGLDLESMSKALGLPGGAEHVNALESGAAQLDSVTARVFEYLSQTISSTLPEFLLCADLDASSDRDGVTDYFVFHTSFPRYIARVVPLRETSPGDEYVVVDDALALKVVQWIDESRAITNESVIKSLCRAADLLAEQTSSLV